MKVAIVAPEGTVPHRTLWPADWALANGVDVDVYETAGTKGKRLVVNDGDVCPDVVHMVIDGVTAFSGTLAKSVEKAVEDGQRVTVDVFDDLWADGGEHKNERRILNAATVVVTPSSATAERLRLRLRRRVLVLRDATYQMDTPDDADPPVTVERTIGWAGTMDGAGESLEALAGVVGRSGCTLVHYGNDDETEAVAAAVGLPARPGGELPMDECALAIVPDIGATSIVQALNWAAAGVPVIGGDGVNMRALAHAGLVVTARRPADWAKLIEAMHDPDYRAQRIATASKNMADWYGQARWAEWVAVWYGVPA